MRWLGASCACSVVPSVYFCLLPDFGGAGHGGQAAGRARHPLCIRDHRDHPDAPYVRLQEAQPGAASGRQAGTTSQPPAALQTSHASPALAAWHLPLAPLHCCRLSWPLAIALLVSAPLLTPLIAQLSRRIGAASKASQAASNDVSAAADEVVENMRVVKLFAQQTRELQRFQGLLDGAHQLAIKVSARGGRGGLFTAHGERLGSR